MKVHYNEINCFREGFCSFGERSNVEIGHLMKDIVLKSDILVKNQQVLNWMQNRQKINCFRKRQILKSVVLVKELNLKEQGSQSSSSFKRPTNILKTVDLVEDRNQYS